MDALLVLVENLQCPITGDYYSKQIFYIKWHVKGTQCSQGVNCLFPKGTGFGMKKTYI